MPTSFHSFEVWPTLRTAVRKERAPADVAVAYFADKASAMLPLAPGSRLVVDASEYSVRAGRTCPAELAKLVRRGVYVFSVPNLHAKVIVLGRRAFIGSANVSRNSRDALVEAVVATDERRVVASARRFVRSLCVGPSLGLEALTRLQKLYRPPKLEGVPATKRRTGSRVALPTVRVVQLVTRDPPSGGDSSYDEGQAVARGRMERPRAHVLGEFFWSGSCAFQRGDVVVQVLKMPNGRRMVWRPGRVLNVRRWSSRGPRRYWVFVEVPEARRVEVGLLAKRIGYGAKKALSRSGRVDSKFAERLLRAWKPA